jgi:hypothetical protein
MEQRRDMGERDSCCLRHAARLICDFGRIRDQRTRQVACRRWRGHHPAAGCRIVGNDAAVHRRDVPRLRARLSAEPNWSAASRRPTSTSSCHRRRSTAPVGRAVKHQAAEPIRACRARATRQESAVPGAVSKPPPVFQSVTLWSASKCVCSDEMPDLQRLTLSTNLQAPRLCAAWVDPCPDCNGWLCSLL